MHHLIAFLVRIVEFRVHGDTFSGDLKLTKREAHAFKRQAGKGGDERGMENVGQPKVGRLNLGTAGTQGSCSDASRPTTVAS